MKLPNKLEIEKSTPYYPIVFTLNSLIDYLESKEGNTTGGPSNKSAGAVFSEEPAGDIKK